MGHRLSAVEKHRHAPVPRQLYHLGDRVDGAQGIGDVTDRKHLCSFVEQCEQGIDIEAAKIVTIGEKAEDVFYVCRESGGALDAAAQQKLGDALLERLGSGKEE